MATAIRIAHRPIGNGHPPFIVAEMSGNHNQSLDRALAIVDAAARAGADALKLQTYTADTMTLDVADGAFRIDDERSLWKGRTLHDLYREAYTPWAWHEPLFKRCRELGLTAFSSPFDATAIDLLESLGAPAYKIASFEITDLPLIRKAAGTGKPVIISTGMATIAEIDDAVSAARGAGDGGVVLLKCTSSYPSSPSGANLRTLPRMAELFDAPVGLSDHTMGLGTAVAAVAFGAVLIEKHFTLRRADGGVDSAFSAEPEELAALVRETRAAAEALGECRFGPTAEERASLRHRRSLYVVRDLPAGATLSADNVRAIRPGDGLSPKYYDIVLGRTLARDVTRGTPLSWDLFR